MSGPVWRDRENKSAHLFRSGPPTGLLLISVVECFPCGEEERFAYEDEPMDDEYHRRFKELKGVTNFHGRLNPILRRFAKAVPCLSHIQSVCCIRHSAILLSVDPSKDQELDWNNAVVAGSEIDQSRSISTKRIW